MFFWEFYFIWAWLGYRQLEIIGDQMNKDNYSLNFT